VIPLTPDPVQYVWIEYVKVILVFDLQASGIVYGNVQNSCMRDEKAYYVRLIKGVSWLMMCSVKRDGPVQVQRDQI
jgi:hypothetical protein